MSSDAWKTLPFETAVQSRGSGSLGLAQKEWLPQGRFPVIGQGADDIEGWTDRDDLLLTPTPAVVLYGGHTRRAKHVSQPFVPGPNVKILQPIATVDSKFLFYFLTHLPIESKGYADHFPLVRKSDVPVPPLPEQQRIVGILDEAFEGIATAKANAEKNLQNARALFESHLQSVFSQRGEGWVETTIGEHIHFIDYRGKTPEKTESGMRLITAKNVKMGFLQETPMEFVVPNSYDDWMTRGIPRCGDVLFTTEAPLANVAQLDTDEKVVFAQRIIIMQPDASTLDCTFLKYLLLSQPVQQRIHAKGTGATVKGIKASLLKTIEILFPKSLNEQKQIVAKLDALAEETQRLESIYQQKLAALDALKKSLLHQAFSGHL